MTNPNTAAVDAEPTESIHWRVSPQMGMLLLCLLVGVIYYPGLRAPFIFDDENQIVFNNNLRHWQLKSYWNEARPFGYLTFALNFAAGGLKPWGYRVVNVAIHAASACLLFDLIRRTLQLPQFQKRFQNRGTELALLIAALWASHPLNTSAVTYVVQRFESLMGLFFLLAIYALLRGASSDSSRRRWFVVGLIASVLGGLSKEIIVVLPVVTLLFDRAFLARTWQEVGRERWKWHLAFCTAPVISFVITYHSLAQRAEVSAGFSLKTMTAWDYLRSQPVVLLHYLRLSCWPDTLILDYGWPVTPADDWLRIFGCGAVVLAGLLVGVVWYLRQSAVGFCVLAWFLILAPTSSILPIADLCFEHRIYLSLAAFCAAVVFSVDALVARWSDSPHAAKSFAMVAMLVIAALGIRTLRRNVDYLSPLTMWTQSADYNPKNSRAQNNAAKELARLPGREEEAIARYQKAIAALPTSAMFPDNLGTVYARLAKYTEAITWFEKGLDLEPDYLPARLHLSKAYLLVGRDDDAWRVLAEVSKSQQKIPDVVKQKSWVRALATAVEVRDGTLALEILQPLLKRDPKFHDPLLRDNLALAYAAAQEFDNALPLAREAVDFYKKTRQSDLYQLAQKRLACYEKEQPWTVALEREHLQSSRRVPVSVPASELP